MSHHGPHPRWRTSSPSRAGRALPFFIFGAIVTVACLCAAARWGLSHGILFTASGALILAYPPRFRQHPGWGALGLAWLACGLLAFMPISWAGGAEWRELVGSAGLGISGLVSPQPIETAVVLAQLAVLGMVALWITGHGCSDETRATIAFAFVGMVGALCALDLALRSVEGTLPHQADFGFFPNRNHSACLVVMASVTALGLLVHGVRRRRPSEFLVAGTLLGFLVFCLFTRSSSRAGIILLLPSVLAWVILLGKDYLRGNAGKACALLLLATSLGFLLSESTVKNRISNTFRAVSASAYPSRNADPSPPSPEEIDGRFPIASETFALIRENAWTGCGAGQFRYVFPQYRKPSLSTDGSDVLHPESSWLWIAAETGLPSALIAFTLAGWILLTAARESRKAVSRCKALRGACVASALVPMIHGFFDVSPHRAGILWSAALLTAIALPIDRRRAGTTQSWAWRITGTTILGFGILLLARHSLESPLLPSEAAERLLKKSWHAYERDAASNERDPAESGEPDPLLKGIRHLTAAAELTPMEGRVHGLLGTLALHFDDKDAIADQAFARQRLLNPSWVRLPLMQADSWQKIDPVRVASLWQEAVQRARDADSRGHETGFEEEITSHIRKTAGKDPSLTGASRAALGPQVASDEAKPTTPEP